MVEDAMNAHAEVLDLLGAWALDACDSGEAAAVEAHLSHCHDCATEARQLRAAASWLGFDRVEAPPPGLRQATLAKARQRRAPMPAATLVEAYADQVALLDRLLGTVQFEDWRRTDPRHGDMRGMIVHLAGNDARLAADTGLRVVTGVSATREAWRSQAEVLLGGLRQIGLDRPVRLAGAGQRLHPLRDALVQRAFETWIHRDDLAMSIGAPQPAPPPEQVRRIVDLAVRLLPDVLLAHGVSRPGGAARLALTGAAGGEWTFPVGDRVPTERVEVTITADAVEFARLVANRRSPDTLGHTVAGDLALAAAVLRIATALGCD
jgi:hypothetical protein